MENENELKFCRKKGGYPVDITLGCYKLDRDHPLLDGFEEKTFVIDGVEEKFAVKSGFNVLEQNSWTASPDRPYIITGTVGEMWPVKKSNLTAYDVDPDTIGIEPKTVFSKDPSEQEFMVAKLIPIGTTFKVIPSWAFSSDGKIDESQAMIANSESSIVPHEEGDYVVAKHIPGYPEYVELPDDVRNTREMAKLYSPRIINGSVMKTTYDCAATKEEIIAKYQSNTTRAK